MEWLDIGAYLTLLTGTGTVWWRLNSRIDTLDTKFERKFDQMDRKVEQKFDQLDQKFERKFDQINTLLLSLSHDIGELKGATHGHAPPAD